VLVDCFTQTSPTAALQGGLLPLWLPFNCSDSVAFLRRMAPDFPRKKPVLLAPVPTYSPSWDVCPAADWVDACGSNAGITWIGANPAAYPVDLNAMFAFVPDLQAWLAAHPATGLGARPPFGVTDLEALIATVAAAGDADDRALEGQGPATAG
jgi:hypothetical protein